MFVNERQEVSHLVLMRQCYVDPEHPGEGVPGRKLVTERETGKEN